MKVKLTEYGTASPLQKLSKDDERSAALARRAQQGGYDEGKMARNQPEEGTNDLFPQTLS
jgi:hypothetical protein